MAKSSQNRLISTPEPVRIYDCTALLADPAFRLLHDEALFRAVQADPHGYGVVWPDDLDLSESELWLNGELLTV